MIVHLPRRTKYFSHPTAVPDIARVDKMNILGITVSDTLTFRRHIPAIVAKGARAFYALKTIRPLGLNGNVLWDLTRATLVSPAWWRYLKADERHRASVRHRESYMVLLSPRSFITLDELREDSDEKSGFFFSRCNPNRALYSLLSRPENIDTCRCQCCHERNKTLFIECYSVT